MTESRGLLIDCQDLVELLTDYLDDALDSELRVTIEAHLALCDGCDAYLDQLRSTRAALGSLDGVILPPALRDDLLHAFRNLPR